MRSGLVGEFVSSGPSAKRTETLSKGAMGASKTNSKPALIGSPCSTRSGRRQRQRILAIVRSLSKTSSSAGMPFFTPHPVRRVLVHRSRVP